MLANGLQIYSKGVHKDWGQDFFQITQVYPQQAQNHVFVEMSSYTCQELKLDEKALLRTGSWIRRLCWKFVFQLISKKFDRVEFNQAHQTKSFWSCLCTLVKNWCWMRRSCWQLVFQYIPKVFSGVDVRTLCRPLKFLHSKLAQVRKWSWIKRLCRKFIFQIISKEFGRVEFNQAHQTLSFWSWLYIHFRNWGCMRIPCWQLVFQDISKGVQWDLGQGPLQITLL